MASFNPVTLGNLISKDLKQANILPVFPLTFGKHDNVPFINDKKYRFFDINHTNVTSFNSYPYAWMIMPIAGIEFDVLVDREPETEWKEHWKQWLPVFPSASSKSISEGLADEKPLVTMAALQSVPVEKHSVHPDVLYELNLKSTIPKIGVPCPRHMTEENATYPCLVKVNMSWCGMGNTVARNKAELTDAIQHARKAGWEGDFVIQEYLGKTFDDYCCYMYLFKTGEIYWMGVFLASFGHDHGMPFEAYYGHADWEKEGERKSLVYEEFILPLAKFLHKEGYFGPLSAEILVTKNGKFLVDLNLRISGFQSYLMAMPYMAHLGFTKSCCYLEKQFDVKALEIIHKANIINKSTDKGRIIVFMDHDPAADCTKECKLMLSVYGRSPSDLEDLTHGLES